MSSNLPLPSHGLLHLHNHQGKTDTARYEGLDWYLSLRCVHLPALQLVPVQHPTDNHMSRYYSCFVYIQELAPLLEATMVRRQDTFGIAPPTEDLNRGVAASLAVHRSVPCNDDEHRLNDVVVIVCRLPLPS
ncbi:hypothetical protein B0H10DRAFT_2217259 [Mycena sp. CBHHK59/15]|nr:hypothetical protein B0H10DRAFT_2217259 [Mycena sp. CBHHK59/15]